MAEYPAVAVETKEIEKYYRLFTQADFMKLEREYTGVGKKTWHEVILEGSWDGKKHVVALRGYVSRFSIDLVSALQASLEGQRDFPVLEYDSKADDEEK